MPELKLSLDTLGELDAGRARLVIDAALAKCVAVEPDASTQTFLFVPLPLEIERAISDGEGWIGNQLEHGLLVPVSEGGALTPAAPCYYGKP